MMACALCREAQELRDSHIIPEFLYKQAYDEKHRIVLVERGVERPVLLQKGLRWPLLCDRCEQTLNTGYEQPMSQRWSQLVPQEVANEFVELNVADLSTFELFHLSILWRANHANGREWSPVALGDKHAENLRAGLLQKRLPAGVEYPIFATMFLDGNAPASRWLGTTSVSRYNNARVYSTLYGGCMWHVVVSSHAAVPSNNPFRLSRNGRMVLPVFPVTEMRSLNLRPLLEARGGGGARLLD